MRVKADEMTLMSLEMLRLAGATDEEAEIITDVLIDTSLRGIDSHGIRAVPRYIRELQSGKLQSGVHINVLREGPTTAMWDAGAAIGFVAAKKAMDTAIQKAKRYQVGSVGYMGTGHLGALYYYTQQAVDADMIGAVLQRGARHLVPPYGGVEGRLGTNPFAVGIPAGNECPLFLDMATNAVATGHFLTMRLRGQSVPDGWIINQEGEWVNEYEDQAAVEGRIAPVSFGGVTNEYKGYGIKAIFEAIAGAIGVGCSLDEKGFGCLFLALDPEAYCDLEDFKSRVDAMIQHVKTSRKRPGVQEIFLPGEIELRERERRRRTGIYLDKAFWDNIKTTAEQLNLIVEDYISEITD
jgi:LDH2 family malate/lactate/ureidoglycolate dehydrogenase